jgi:hypothetical protein
MVAVRAEIKAVKRSQWEQLCDGAFDNLDEVAASLKMQVAKT